MGYVPNKGNAYHQIDLKKFHRFAKNTEMLSGSSLGPSSKSTIVAHIGIKADQTGNNPEMRPGSNI
jgi:hypothetical protein